MFYYKIYGLIVKSELELPEAFEVNENEVDKVDINIKLENIQKDIIALIDAGRVAGYRPKDMWFRIENVGIFHIKNGDAISVQIFDNANLDKVRVFIMGSSLGMLLLEREEIAIHGGTIIVDNKAVIITGDSGAGKTTLTSCFRENGYKFLADDVSALSFIDDQIYVEPALPIQKLCKDALTNFGHDINKLKRIDDEREKYVLPLKDIFQINHCVLNGIFEVVPYDGEVVKIEEIKGHEKFKLILKNIYRFFVFDFCVVPPMIIKKCLMTAEKTRIYRVYRPNDKFTVNEQMEIITQIMKGVN